ncbi:hypothetical protein D3C80_2068570 [compost metagenome]
MIDKHRERSSEAPVEQSQTPGALRQVQVLGCLQYSKHDGLERNQHRHNTEEIDHSAPFSLGPGQLVSRNGGD